MVLGLVGSLGFRFLLRVSSGFPRGFDIQGVTRLFRGVSGLRFHDLVLGSPGGCEDTRRSLGAGVQGVFRRLRAFRGASGV